MNVPSQIKFILGTPIQEFDNKKFRKLFHLAKTLKELHHAKSYLYRYFARGKVDVYKWDPKNQIFEYYNKKDACESFIQSEHMIFKNDKGEFGKEIRDAVKLILNHMREVLCSSNKDQELYMMGLILRIAIGQKMLKSMFLYSGPGTGKTMLTWFLRIMVLSSKISTKTSNEKIITGSFNKELEGKVLLVLEEMSNSKSTDWITFANRLKDFIDSDTIMIEEKYKTPYFFFCFIKDETQTNPKGHACNLPPDNNNCPQHVKALPNNLFYTTKSNYSYL
ncbi:hypothetical protein Glove_40g114 [Diversispora epigaea]|uniref:NrS-1 polymerase-like helicase domain-containing protein n=1 Tax=Diversispora epigaea TaxID=1348612 RepID=A0A397JIM7_9GLOM|nr:hypothetical protein Glove_40g113 [Diversispora epigaea]RHZ87112.1 hypothetical protein Glove_40g114 [Diversispora epigaea]